MADVQEISIRFQARLSDDDTEYAWMIECEPQIPPPDNPTAFQAIIATLTPAMLVLCRHIVPNASEGSDVTIHTTNDLN